AGESRVAVDEGEPLSPGLEAVHRSFPPSGDNRVLTVDDCRQVDLDLFRDDTQPAAGARDVRRPGTGDHRLRRRATRIDAGSAGVGALGDDHPLAGARESCGERTSRLATTDNNDVYVHDPPRLCPAGPSMLCKYTSTAAPGNASQFRRGLN